MEEELEKPIRFRNRIQEVITYLNKCAESDLKIGAKEQRHLAKLLEIELRKLNVPKFPEFNGRNEIRRKKSWIKKNKLFIAIMSLFLIILIIILIHNAGGLESLKEIAFITTNG